MSRKVAFGAPQRPAEADFDKWVQGQPAGQAAEATQEPAEATKPVEPMRRLTIDVPDSLHIRIKVTCTLRKQKIADAIRELLEREFAHMPPLEQ
jgi:hypothetical protein